MGNIIKATDINNLNQTVYNYGSQAKINTKLSSQNLDSPTGNNVMSETKIDNSGIISVKNLQDAIKILETNFSNNCCQSNCNSTTSTTSCQTCQSTTCQSTTCQRCQTCQGCQTCQRQCSYYNYYSCSC